jgi:hypothetical protein
VRMLFVQGAQADSYHATTSEDAKKLRLLWVGVLNWMAYCRPNVWLFDHF